MKFVKSIFVICFILLICIIIFVSLILTSKSSVLASNIISAQEVVKAKKFVNDLTNQISLNSKNINISLSSEDLILLSHFISQTVPKLDIRLNLSAQQVYTAVSYRIDILSIKKYVNASCIIIQQKNYISVDECYIGKLSLPSALVEFLAMYFIKTIISEEQLTHYQQLYQQITLTDNMIAVSLTNLTDVKSVVQKTSNQLFDIGKPFILNSGVNNTQVEFYINLIEKSQLKSNSLAPYLIELFQNVEKYSNKDDAIAENKAALWALVIVFGNKKLAHFLGENYQPKKDFIGKRIHNRQDLGLHFLYSIFLELTGEQYIAAKIGEYKELLDGNKGGSGFSFADLAADLAGIKLSKELTSDAKRGSKILQQFTHISQNNMLESMVFPSISGLPEGISEAKFTKIYGNVDSDKYKKIIQKINSRINQLYIYQ